MPNQSHPEEISCVAKKEAIVLSKYNGHNFERIPKASARAETRMLGSRLLQSALCRGKAAPWGLGTAVAYSTSPPPLPPAPPSAPPVQAASPAKPMFASRGDYLRKLLVKDRLGASPAAASLRQVVRASVGGFLGIA